MEHFIINSTICLFILWLFYKIALENISWHNFKRFYLLTSVLISLSIPFIVVRTLVLPLKTASITADTSQNAFASNILEQGFDFQLSHFFILLYLTGASFMFMRFYRNIKHFRLKKEDSVDSYANYVLILRNEEVIPHSFFNRIILSKKAHLNNLIDEAIYKHEKAHLDQKHSLDILLIELLILFFWFNPMLYLYRYSIRLNHEFLADRSVLQNKISRSTYQNLILQHASNSYQQSMANTFHFPLIKKRFNIMKTKTSTLNGLLRSLIVIPVVTILILSCGEEEVQFQEENIIIEEEFQDPFQTDTSNDKTILISNNQKSGTVKINDLDYTFTADDKGYTFYSENGELFDYKKEGYTVLEIVEIFEELTPSDIEEYNKLAKEHKAYIEEHGVIVLKDKTQRMQLLYNTMSQTQKAENEPWPYTGMHYGQYFGEGTIPPPPPPPAPSLKTTTKSSLN